MTGALVFGMLVGALFRNRWNLKTTLINIFIASAVWFTASATVLNDRDGAILSAMAFIATGAILWVLPEDKKE